MPLMRIPYTAPLPDPTIFPASARTLAGAVSSLSSFLLADKAKTVLVTGAGISVASGLADYRGTKGTYTLNKTYRPIYFHEFCASHAARKRYWARSFLGWTTLNRSKPNAAHHAVARLGRLGVLSNVITQNVDSFHPRAHPDLKTIELHGYLRSVVCLSCHTEYDRRRFQTDLAELNPAWATFLAEMLDSGAMATENPDERRKRGLKTNPDGDVDVPGIEYSTFRYPPCPTCLQRQSRTSPTVQIDADGAWHESSSTGILKPAVIMFGESIPGITKTLAEEAIDQADRVLVLGSSLATYSAWRLIKRAKDADKGIAIANLGGARGEEQLFRDAREDHHVRCAQPLETLLPTLADAIEACQSS